jgi:hypothetical protein
MQGKGAEIDIVTGKPVVVQMKQAAEERKTADEASLKRQAEMAGIIHSDAGQVLIAMIMDRLQARIENCLVTDPEAASYVKILQEMGNRDRLGREAMKKIVQSKLGQAL